MKEQSIAQPLIVKCQLLAKQTCRSQKDRTISADCSCSYQKAQSYVHSHPENPTEAATAIIVLGMHRSGTSALTGLLEICGATMPVTQFEPNQGNAKGFFEARPVADFNDRLLASHELSWHHWASTEPIETSSNRAAEIAEACEVLDAEFGNATCVALKDPRICRLLPFWLEVLQKWGRQPRAIFALRHPLEVAQSLEVRNGFSIAQGLLLWTAYILDAELHSRGLSRSFSHFASLLDEPVQTLSRLDNELGGVLPLKPNAQEDRILSFLSRDLRHHDEGGLDQLPMLITRLYEILLNWTIHTENTADHAEIDAIRARFNGLRQCTDQTDVLFEALRIQEADPTQIGSIDGLEPNDIVVRCQALAALNNLAVVEKNHHLAEISLLQDENLRIAETHQAELQSKTQELTALTHSLQQTTSEVQQLSEALTAQENVNQHLDHDNNTLRAQIATGKAERDQLATENAELRTQVELAFAQWRAISESTIWRATSPIRKLINALRRKR